MEVVTPWNMKNFNHSQLTLQNINDNLTRLGYPLEDYKKTPYKQLVAATNLVIKLLQELKEENRMPWILLFTTSASLAQALAHTAPMSHALTTAESCYTTDNAELTELFRTPSPRNPFDYDEPGERLEEITTAGLLFWRDLDVKTGGAIHQSGRFLKVLNHRMQYEIETVFSIVRTETVGRNAVPAILELVGQNLGETVALTIQQCAEVRMLTVAQKTTGYRKSRL